VIASHNEIKNLQKEEAYLLQKYNQQKQKTDESIERVISALSAYIERSKNVENDSPEGNHN